MDFGMKQQLQWKKTEYIGSMLLKYNLESILLSHL